MIRIKANLITLIFIIVCFIAVIVTVAYKFDTEHRSNFSNIAEYTNTLFPISIDGFVSPIMKEDGTFFYISKNMYEYNTEDCVGVYMEYGKSLEYTTGIVRVYGRISKANKDSFDIVEVNAGGKVGYILKEEFTKEKLQYILDNKLGYKYVYTDGSGNTFTYKIYKGQKTKEMTNVDDGKYTGIKELLQIDYNGFFDEKMQEIQKTVSNKEVSEEIENKLGVVMKEINEQNEIDTIQIGILRNKIKQESNSEAITLLNELEQLANEVNTKIKSGMSESDEEGLNKKAEKLYSEFMTFVNSIELE